MNKYIDRDKLAEFARHSTNGIDANDIMRFPTADVVEVVRCKDCKYRIKEWRGDKRLKDTGYWAYGCEHFAELMGYWGWGGNDNDFCSYGERRETE